MLAIMFGSFSFLNGKKSAFNVFFKNVGRSGPPKCLSEKILLYASNSYLRSSKYADYERVVEFIKFKIVDLK